MVKRRLIPKMAAAGADCEACGLGKMHHLPSKPPASCAEGALDLLHSDVCGPFLVKLHRRCGCKGCEW
jgi:hypothetical protein